MNEWKLLESGFVEFQTELAVHRSNVKALPNNDNFISVADEFFKAHQEEVQELKKNVQEMNTEVSSSDLKVKQ